MKVSMLALMLGSVLLAAGCGTDTAPKQTITLYKSYTCGCCGGWKEHMEDNGYKVNVVNMEDAQMPSIKSKYRIHPTLQSCHTAVVGDYIVEGHVPAKVVDDLLTARPAIDGIALPGMPAGSPGMPGKKQGAWKIYSMTNGEISVYDEI